MITAALLMLIGQEIAFDPAQNQQAAEELQQSKTALSNAVDPYPAPDLTDLLDLTPDNSEYQVTTDGNVRAGPNTAFRVNDIVEMGEIIKARGRAGGWIAIEHNGVTGFIWKDLVTNKKRQE